MTRGVLLFAHNNEAFNYHELVTVGAWFIKKHLDVPIWLVTDTITREKLADVKGIDDLIDDFIIVDHYERNGRRVYHAHDGNRTKVVPGEFRNKTRIDMYELSPFDETLYMDLDYIVMNNRLSEVWGSESPVRMNYQISALRKDHHSSDATIGRFGIPMYWSTVMYFRKSPEAKIMFDGIRYIKQNYRYFANLYGFTDHLYRNDVALSIMAHCMNGGMGSSGICDVVSALPEPTLVFAWDDQPILKIDDTKMWFVGLGTTEFGGTHTFVSHVVDQSVHVVNKASILQVLKPWVDAQIGTIHD